LRAKAGACSSRAATSWSIAIQHHSSVGTKLPVCSDCSEIKNQERQMVTYMAEVPDIVTWAREAAGLNKKDR